MTEQHKPRWTPEQKRDARGARRGKESRAEYRGEREDRRFGVGMVNAATNRAATTGTGSSAIAISGSPIQYAPVSYPVFGQYGSFTERIAAGAVSSILATADTRFFYDHGGLTMARTTSGTLVLSDTPQSLNCTATLDPRQTVAADLALAIGRADVREMSIGFVVGDDVWNSDFSDRTITRISSLLDVSAVGTPASPTTSIELLEAPAHLMPVGGEDGTQGGGSGNAPGIGNQDGTGSRSAERALRISQARRE